MADKPKTNVDKFFEIYDADPALQARVQQAMDCYPGSLEIRDVMTEHVLLPVAEELVFRGAALRLLRPLGRNAAILGQAVLFAALHGSLRAKAYALGMGLLFGWAADRSGSLLPGILLHILNNGAVLARCLAERGTP